LPETKQARMPALPGSLPYIEPSGVPILSNRLIVVVAWFEEMSLAEISDGLFVYGIDHSHYRRTRCARLHALRRSFNALVDSESRQNWRGSETAEPRGKNL
jgi:hypothetical protein